MTDERLAEIESRVKAATLPRRGMMVGVYGWRHFKADFLELLAEVKRLRAPLPDARMVEIEEKNELARLCAPTCPGTFLAPLCDYVDELLAEVKRLRSAGGANQNEDTKTL